MLDPKLILLDEPAGGINPTLIERMGEMIRELNARGKTFLIVEHNMPFVLGLCDPVLVLARGAASRAARPAQIQRDPKVLDAYLGDSTRGAGGGLMLLGCRGVVAGYGGGDVLQGVDLEVAAGLDRLHRRAQRRRQVDGAARGQRPAAPARGRDRARRRPAAPALAARRSCAAGVAQVPQSDALFAEHHGAGERADGRLHRSAATGRSCAAATPRSRSSSRSCAERAGEKAGNLSGGQRRMVEFARVADARPAARAARRAVAGPRPEGAQARAARASARMSAGGQDDPAGRAERALRAAAGDARDRDGERARAAAGAGARGARQPRDGRPVLRRLGQAARPRASDGGALWAARVGHRVRALPEHQPAARCATSRTPYVSTFLHVAIASAGPAARLACRPRTSQPLLDAAPGRSSRSRARASSTSSPAGRSST